MSTLIDAELLFFLKLMIDKAKMIFNSHHLINQNLKVEFGNRDNFVLKEDTIF